MAPIKIKKSETPTRSGFHLVEVRRIELVHIGAHVHRKAYKMGVLRFLCVHLGASVGSFSWLLAIKNAPKYSERLPMFCRYLGRVNNCDFSELIEEQNKSCLFHTTPRDRAKTVRKLSLFLDIKKDPREFPPTG